MPRAALMAHVPLLIIVRVTTDSLNLQMQIVASPFVILDVPMECVLLQINATATMDSLCLRTRRSVLQYASLAARTEDALSRIIVRVMQDMRARDPVVSQCVPRDVSMEYAMHPIIALVRKATSHLVIPMSVKQSVSSAAPTECAFHPTIARVIRDTLRAQMEGIVNRYVRRDVRMDYVQPLINAAATKDSHCQMMGCLVSRSVSLVA